MITKTTPKICSIQIRDEHEDFNSVESELRKKNKLMEEELRLATEFQRAVLPDPIILGYIETSIIYQPYAIVSGDIYDFLLNREGELGVFVGDVTGHGIAAALMTMMVQLALDTLRRDLSTDEYIRRLNKLISKRQTDRSVTGVFFRITPTGKLTVTHAAHPPLLIMPADGSDIIKFESGGCALGLFADEPVPYEEENTQLKERDKIFAYTDAIIEWCNNENEIFGINRLVDFLDRNREYSIQDLSKMLMQELENYSNGVKCNDDITVCVLEFLGK